MTSTRDCRIVFVVSAVMTVIFMGYFTLSGVNRGHFQYVQEVQNIPIKSQMKKRYRPPPDFGESVKKKGIFSSFGSETEYRTGSGKYNISRHGEKLPTDSERTQRKSTWTQYSGRVTLKSPDYRKDYLKVESIFMDIRNHGSKGNVSIHPLAKDEPYKSRLKKIRDACDKHPDGKYTSLIDLKRLLYDDKHKVIMCVIPKVACSTWKLMMYYLMGRSSLKDAFKVPRSKIVMNYGDIKSMARLNPDEILQRLNTYTKFTVVRNPYSRLVSAYRNKFDPNPLYERGTQYNAMAREIARKAIAQYLPGFNITFRRSMQYMFSTIYRNPVFQKLSTYKQKQVFDIARRGFHRNVTFEEFARFGVIKSNRDLVRKLDVHWRPQHMLCNPCAINYDYVIHFDNLKEESERLLSYMQRNDPVKDWIHFPGGRTPAVNKNAAIEEFATLSPELRKKLRGTYQYDFDYFGFNASIV